MDISGPLGKNRVIMVHVVWWRAVSVDALNGERRDREKLFHPIVRLKFFLVRAAANFETAIVMLHDLRVAEAGDQLSARRGACSVPEMTFHAGKRSRGGRTFTGVARTKNTEQKPRKPSEGLLCIFYAFHHFEGREIVENLEFAGDLLKWSG